MKSNVIQIPGKMLVPSFSVYLYHFKHPQGAYYYVGMTGDNFYPSARSAIHRLSGHFELQKQSTQNQLNKRIIELGGVNWIKDVTINYYHWPISGFTPFPENKGKFKPQLLEASQKKAYEQFKFRRNEVLQLEKHLISKTKDRVSDRCWNKAVSQGSDCPIEFSEIAEAVLDIVR